MTNKTNNLTKTQLLNKILSKSYFESTKETRKITIEEVFKEYAKNMNASIMGSHKGYSYFIVWRRNEGITSYIYKDGKVLTIGSQPCKGVSTIEKSTIKWINIFSKKLELFYNKN